VKDGDEVEAGTSLASRGGREIVATTGGKVSRKDRQVVIRYERREGRGHEVPSAARLLEDRYDIKYNWKILVQDGDEVEAGTPLASGARSGSMRCHRPPGCRWKMAKR
jgi:hypothetical protein